jgi:hypothetical protein
MIRFIGGLGTTSGIIGALYWVMCQPWAWIIFYALGCAGFALAVFITYHVRQGRLWHARRAQQAELPKRGPLWPELWQDQTPGVALGHTGGNREDHTHATTPAARPGPPIAAQGPQVSGGEQLLVGGGGALTGRHR